MAAPRTYLAEFIDLGRTDWQRPARLARLRRPKAGKTIHPAKYRPSDYLATTLSAMSSCY